MMMLVAAWFQSVGDTSHLSVEGAQEPQTAHRAAQWRQQAHFEVQASAALHAAVQHMRQTVVKKGRVLPLAEAARAARQHE
jgi:hypothetical protein